MTIEEAIALHRAGRVVEAERAYRALIAANPRDPDALHFFGVLRAQGGDITGAIDLIGRSLAVDPEAPQAHFHFANSLVSAGRTEEALSHFERAVALQPGYAQAQFGRIGVLIDLGRAAEALALCRSLPRHPQTADLTGRALMAMKSYAEALAAFENAVELKNDFLKAHYHRADALHALGRNQEALEVLAGVLAASPEFAEAHLARGNVLLALDRTLEGLEAIDRALSLKPDLAEAHAARATAAISLKRWRDCVQACDRALALKPSWYDAHLSRSRALAELRRFDEALSAAEHAVALRPDVVECHTARANALMKLGRAAEALAAIDAALARQPDSASMLVNRACVLIELDRTDEAFAAFARAIERDPKSAPAHYNLGNALAEMARYEEALAAYDTAIVLKPDWAEAHYNRADALESLGRREECLVACERSLAVDPHLGLALSKRFAMKAGLCDWHDRLAGVAAIKELCRDAALVDPFATLLSFDDPVLHLNAVRTFAGPARPGDVRVHAHERLRVAYLSPDFRDHPVAHQIVELLERHDRTRFELFGICLQSAEGSPIRSRIKAAFEHFIEAETRTDAGIAALLKENEIDIAVDLAGYTEKGRTRALSYRPAPVAVNFLGFSGSLGADYVDYIIADEVVAPPGHDAFFSEKIVCLPHCFFPTDSQGRGHPAPSRAEEGLPQNGFVFCTFNNTFKIVPELFDIWMRLLAAVEGSVLWLRVDNPIARNNLRREAEQRGIAPERLIFGERAPRERHLARIALADLFLDSTPYNAHTTCNDALWAGLPLVTCPGKSFASRVAASMLTVSGTEELIVPDLTAYECLALELTRSPARLAALRERLVSGRSANPLFDMAGLCRALEQAYQTMWDIRAKAQPPRDFSVPGSDGV